MARTTSVRLILVTLLACAAGRAAAAGSPTSARAATLAQLFPAAELGALSKTLRVDEQVRFRVRTPPGGAPAGVLVFISARDSGELPAAWAKLLDDRHLAWIAAEGFGNSRPTAERILVAVMALKLMGQTPGAGERRSYVAGMSGGGRAASLAISHFPALFDGAIFMAGADFYLPEDAALRRLVLRRRLAFITGGQDFNHREMQLARDRYRDAGATSVLWLDQPTLAHELPGAEVLGKALDFLDGN